MARILIIAGEPSGDLHAAGVVRELLRQRPGWEVVGIGGPQMAAAGMTCFHSTDEMAILGFVEVLRHFPFIRHVMNEMKTQILQNRPDLVILVDYPGFNLRFARFVHRQGIPILYYISPQVWAWGKGRVKKMAKWISRMAVIFPFEEEIYRRAGVDVTFVGHPLLEKLGTEKGGVDLKGELGIPPSGKIFGLLPGSRPQEVRKLLPEMIRTFEMLREEFPELEGVVSQSPQLQSDFYAHFLAPELKLTPHTEALMRSSYFMLVASGTATLEAALAGTPFAVVYRLAPLSYFIGKHLISVEHIGMVNIVAGRRVVPEFIQRDFRAEKMVPEIGKILRDPSKYKAIQAALSEIPEKLGTPGASRRVAEMAIDMVEAP